MYAQIITTKVSENANSGVVKWCGWQSLGKVVTLAGVIREGFLGEVLFGWIEGCEDVWDPGGRWQDKIPLAYYQRVHTGGWMALGVPILVLIWDLPPQGGNIFLGVAAPPSGRLEAQAERTEGKRPPGREDWEEKAGHWRKGGGCRSGQNRSSRPTCDGAGSERPPGSRASVSFIYREGNEEVPEYSSWVEPWRAPNLSHYFAGKGTEGQRRCVRRSPWI